MAPPKTNLLPLAAPKYGIAFDTWNSSSTGHQRAENKLGGPIGWRKSRCMKLSHQFKDQESGGDRISDQVGAGSEDWDEVAKTLISKDVRKRARFNIQNMLVVGNTARNTTAKALSEGYSQSSDTGGTEVEAQHSQQGIFDGLVIYINGSTHPLISDHKLKRLLAENGAKVSIHLGRRQVTHVILGKPCSSGSSGAGGGLAAMKMQKEIKTVGGCGIRYVGVEWVLESVKAGKRLSETRFSNLKMALKGQQSVYDMFKRGCHNSST